MQPTATSECSWVRDPVVAPMTVRDADDDTGKPCMSPAPTLDAPSARSSWLSSTCWPAREANARASRMLSL